jgi:hypothetical protein
VTSVVFCEVSRRLAPSALVGSSSAQLLRLSALIERISCGRDVMEILQRKQEALESGFERAGVK